MSTELVSVGLLGAGGRMGQWVSKLLASEFSTRAQLGASADSSDALEPLLKTDVVIDFATPPGAIALTRLALAAATQTPSKPLPAFVIGSTGWKAQERELLNELAQHTTVLVSSNFSTGVLALLEILRKASPMLEKLGYTPVLVETHHRHKKDAPSGTAISLQKAIAPNRPESVQTHAVRAGEIIGDHEVTFYGPGDHVTLGHFAQDRSIFARGSIDVALWLAARRRNNQASPNSHGLVTMNDFFKEQYAV